MRLHRTLRENGRPYRVTQIPEPVCYTEVPEQLGTLGRQRARWYRGLAESLWAHRSMLGRRRYGFVGSIVYPFYVVVELVAPLVEIAGYLWFLSMLLRQAVNGSVAMLYFVVAYLLGIIVSVQSLVLDDMNYRFFRDARTRMALLAAALLENFGYRQLTILFRIQGLLRYLAGDRSWGKMTRKGFRAQSG